MPHSPAADPHEAEEEEGGGGRLHDGPLVPRCCSAPAVRACRAPRGGQLVQDPVDGLSRVGGANTTS